MGRFITTWRKTGEQSLDWDHYVSEDQTEVETVVRNLKARGVHQFHTFKLGDAVPELSSEY